MINRRVLIGLLGASAIGYAFVLWMLFEVDRLIRETWARQC